MARRRPWILRLLLNPLVVIAAVVALVAVALLVVWGLVTLARRVRRRRAN